MNINGTESYCAPLQELDKQKEGRYFMKYWEPTKCSATSKWDQENCPWHKNSHCKNWFAFVCLWHHSLNTKQGAMPFRFLTDSELISFICSFRRLFFFEQQTHWYFFARYMLQGDKNCSDLSRWPFGETDENKSVKIIHISKPK